MPIATFTQSSVLPTLTKLSMADGITAAMQSAGFTLIDTVNGTSEIRAFSYVVNAAATKGTAYVQITINATDLYYTLGDSYSTVSHSMTGGSTYSQHTFQPGYALNLLAINHPEYRGVHFTNYDVNYFGMIGYVRPATKYAWWDENTYLYAFLFQMNQGRLHTLPTGYIPLASSGYSAAARLVDPPPAGGHQLIRSPFLIGASGIRCVMGQFSSDIVSVPSGAVLTEFESGTERFALVLRNLPDTSYLAVKIS
jgi:hypothetical protein